MTTDNHGRLPARRKALNRPLFRRVALRLRRLRHEFHYDQGRWVIKTECGTSACIAGWVAMAEGWKPRNFGEYSIETTWKKGKNQHDDVADIATRLLGVPKIGASALFDYLGGSPVRWPASYIDRWNQHEERRSRIAADLLDAIADGKVRVTRNGLVERKTRATRAKKESSTNA